VAGTTFEECAKITAALNRHMKTMIKSRSLLLLIASTCLALIGAAL
jgi:hypothetical protein